MKKIGLRGLTVSVTTHLYCSCSAAKTHSYFIKEGAQGHQLPDFWCNKAVSGACVRGCVLLGLKRDRQGEEHRDAQDDAQDDAQML